MNAACFKALSAAALAWCLCQAAASAAVTYDWQFPTDASPASPQVGDPAATATINLGAGATGWAPGSTQPALGGLSVYWDIGLSGDIELSFPSTAGQSLEITLTVKQYVQPLGPFQLFDGNLSYSVAGGSQQGSLTTVPVTSPDQFGGRWWEYTTDWQVSSSLTPETVMIFGSPNGTAINGIQLTVEPVPEPIAGILCSAGVVIVASLFHQHRRRVADKQSVSRS